MQSDNQQKKCNLQTMTSPVITNW